MFKFKKSLNIYYICYNVILTVLQVVPNGHTDKIVKVVVVIEQAAPTVMHTTVIALVKMDTLGSFAIAKLVFTTATSKLQTAIPMKKEIQCVFANLGCR